MIFDFLGHKTGANRAARRCFNMCTYRDTFGTDGNSMLFGWYLGSIWAVFGKYVGNNRATFGHSAPGTA